MKIKFIICFLIACMLIGCTSVVKVARYVHDSDKLDNYIYGEAVVVNEYIEKVVKALNTNDRELLVSLFPEYAACLPPLQQCAERRYRDHYPSRLGWRGEALAWPFGIFRSAFFHLPRTLRLPND